MSKPFVSGSCEGERCYCGTPAEHKVEETIFHDDPYPVRHPLTRYVCHAHFREIMGPAADRREPSIDDIALEAAGEIENLDWSNSTQRKARIQAVVAKAIRRA